VKLNKLVANQFDVIPALRPFLMPADRTVCHASRFSYVSRFSLAISTRIFRMASSDAGVGFGWDSRVASFSSRSTIGFSNGRTNWGFMSQNTKHGGRGDGIRRQIAINRACGNRGSNEQRTGVWPWRKSNRTSAQADSFAQSDFRNKSAHSR